MHFIINASYKKIMSEIFVAENGSDSRGDGSLLKPVASLKQALKLTRDKEDKTVICLREGHYTLNEPLVLEKEDSGLHIMGFPGETAVISGASQLEQLVWERNKINPDIWNTFIGTGLFIDQLFIDDVPQIMARYPNYQAGVLPLGGTVSQEEIKERSKNWKNPSTGYIRALHEAGWGGNDYYIRGKSENTPLGLDIEWIGDNNRGNYYKADALVAENIKEELDCEQEWFYDAETGILSVIPQQNVCLGSDTKIEICTNTELFRICGINFENPIENIRISGLILEKTSRTMFTTKQEGKEYISLLRGDWAVVRSGSIYMSNAKNIVIEDCRFSHIGGNAIFAWGYNSDHCICNNEFCHIGSSAIQLVGSPEAVSQPSYWEHMHYPQHTVHVTEVKHPNQRGPVSEDYPRDIEISENHIFDVGIYEKQSSGVNLSVSSRIRILHNTIHNSARSNINVNDGTFGGHEIAYNDIYDSQRERTDHGPFNSWGRDRFWSVPDYNSFGLNGEIIRHYIKDGKEYDIALLDAYQTTKIHHNRFHHDNRETHSWGIDLDDGSSNYEIYKNLCLGIGIKLREGFERNVHHNIIIDGQIQLHCTYKEARDRIYENIIVHKNPWGFAGLGEDEAERLRQGELYIDKNVYFYPDENIYLEPFWKQLGYDQNGLKDVNPAFINLERNKCKITNQCLLDKFHFLNFEPDFYGKKNCSETAPVYLFQKEFDKKELHEQEWKGAWISNVDYAIMSSTGTSGTDGVYFKKVPKDSEAYELGFRTHQVLKYWNGCHLENVEAFLMKMS